MGKGVCVYMKRQEKLRESEWESEKVREKRRGEKWEVVEYWW